MSYYSVVVVLCLPCIWPVYAGYPLNNTCSLRANIEIKSIATRGFVNGKDDVNYIAVWKFAYYRKWRLTAGVGYLEFRNQNNGDFTKLMDVAGGCENIDENTQVILWKKDVSTTNDKWIFNADGTLESACGEGLYMKGRQQGLLNTGNFYMTKLADPSQSTDDIRFKMRFSNF